MDKTRLLALLVSFVTVTVARSASACEVLDPTPTEGFLVPPQAPEEILQVPANAAYLTTLDAGEQLTLAEDRTDGSAVIGVRQFSSTEARGALYLPERPLVVGHEYVARDGRRLVAAPPLAEQAPAAPAAYEVLVHEAEDPGCAVDSCIGASNTLEGLSAAAGSIAFYALRYAASETEAWQVRPIAALTTQPFTLSGPRSGFAAITAFDQAGRESARVVVPIHGEDEDAGGCRATPSSSGAQTFFLLGLAGLFLRRRSRTD